MGGEEMLTQNPHMDPQAQDAPRSEAGLLKGSLFFAGEQRKNCHPEKTCVTLSPDDLIMCGVAPGPVSPPSGEGFVNSNHPQVKCQISTWGSPVPAGGSPGICPQEKGGRGHSES